MIRYSVRVPVTPAEVASWAALSPAQAFEAFEALGGLFSRHQILVVGPPGACV